MFKFLSQIQVQSKKYKIIYKNINIASQTLMKTTNKPIVGYIIVKDHQTLKDKLPVFQGENIIGRVAEKATIIIKDPQVSSAHAKLFVGPNEIQISDMNSKNGTFLDIQQKIKINALEKFKLRQGQPFSLGEVVCVFERVNKNTKNTKQQQKKQRANLLQQLEESHAQSKKVVKKNSSSSSISSQSQQKNHAKQTKVIQKPKQNDIKKKGPAKIANGQESQPQLQIPKKQLPKQKKQSKQQQQKLKIQKQRAQRLKLKKQQEQQQRRLQQQLKIKRQKQQQQKKLKKQKQQQLKRQKKQKQEEKKRLQLDKEQQKKKKLSKKGQQKKKQKTSHDQQLQRQPQDSQTVDEGKKKKLGRKPSNSKAKQLQILRQKDNKKNSKSKSKNQSESSSQKQVKKGSKQLKNEQAKHSKKKLLEVNDRQLHKKSTSKQKDKRKNSQSEQKKQQKKQNLTKNKKRTPAKYSVQKQDNNISKNKKTRARVTDKTIFLLSNTVIQFKPNPQLQQAYDLEEKFDVLVMEKYSRTYKLLIAIMKGIPIVKKSWLIDSEMARKSLEVDDYYLAYLKDKYLIQESVQKVKAGHQVFKDMKFYIASDKKTLHIQLEKIQTLVELGGGEILDEKELKKMKKQKDFYVILQDKYKKQQMQKAKQISKDQIYSIELILQGCVTQQTDFQKYKLQ